MSLLSKDGKFNTSAPLEITHDEWKEMRDIALAGTASDLLVSSLPRHVYDAVKILVDGGFTLAASQVAGMLLHVGAEESEEYRISVLIASLGEALADADFGDDASSTVH